LRVPDLGRIQQAAEGWRSAVRRGRRPGCASGRAPRCALRSGV